MLSGFRALNTRARAQHDHVDPIWRSRRHSRETLDWGSIDCAKPTDGGLVTCLGMHGTLMCAQFIISPLRAKCCLIIYMDSGGCMLIITNKTLWQCLTISDWQCNIRWGTSPSSIIQVYRYAIILLCDSTISLLRDNIVTSCQSVIWISYGVWNLHVMKSQLSDFRSPGCHRRHPENLLSAKRKFVSRKLWTFLSYLFL